MQAPASAPEVQRRLEAKSKELEEVMLEFEDFKCPFSPCVTVALL